MVQKLTTFGKWLRPPMGRCKTRYIFWKKNKSIAFDHTNDGKLNLPTKAFSEIKFTLGGVRPVIQLRPSGLDTFRVKSFLERISQLPKISPKLCNCQLVQNKSLILQIHKTFRCGSNSLNALPLFCPAAKSFTQCETITDLINNSQV